MMVVVDRLWWGGAEEVVEAGFYVFALHEGFADQYSVEAGVDETLDV